MRVAFKFRNLDSSEALKDYATEKLAKLQKYVRAPLEAEVTTSIERHLHCVDVAVSAGAQRYSGREESENMYASIDMVLDKINNQIRKQKSATTALRKSRGADRKSDTR